MDKNCKENKITEFEVKSRKIIDFTNKKIVNICKKIWNNRNNDEILNNFEKQLEHVNI